MSKAAEIGLAKALLLWIGGKMFGNGSSTTPQTLSEFKPLHGICAFLHGVHLYADEASHGQIRLVNATHYCSHLRDDFRQCLIFDSAKKDARLIGIEYMVPKESYEKLAPDEQKLWHSHVFEIKSGALVMPKPALVPASAWDALELQEMNELIGWYGKTFHLWQVDTHQEIPLGAPVLMGSLNSLHLPKLNLDEILGHRDKELGTDYKQKAAQREGIKEPEIHPHAD